MKKKTPQKEYKNVPLPPETYARLQLISEANGYGQRGLGAQVAHWVNRELPECDHEKSPVMIEYFPEAVYLPGTVNNQRAAFYCETCKRVYAKIAEDDLVKEDGKKLLEVVKVK